MIDILLFLDGANIERDGVYIYILIVVPSADIVQSAFAAHNKSVIESLCEWQYNVMDQLTLTYLHKLVVLTVFAILCPSNFAIFISNDYLRIDAV